MCGRFTLTLSSKEVAEILNITEEMEWNPHYNIAPTQPVPVLINNGQKRLNLLQWGLIPFWAKDAAMGSKMINARAETIDTKPSFKHCFQKQRCLILADGFYEWKREGKSKIPYRITIPNRKAFGFAGIWDSWKSPDGDIKQTCSIITTAPNELMSTIHDRMPVILEQEMETIWLDHDITDSMRLKSLLIPYPSKMMYAYQVSTAVNSAKYDDIGCIQSVNEQDYLF